MRSGDRESPMPNRQTLKRPRSFPRRCSLRHGLLASWVLATLAAAAPAQLQFDELELRHLPNDSDPARAVALGDVDGDGDVDVVFGNGSNSEMGGRRAAVRCGTAARGS